MLPYATTQKMKLSFKDFFSKCDQIRSFLRIWLHLLKKSLMGNFIFCAVFIIKDFLLSLLNLEWLRKEMQPIYRFVLRGKFFPLLFTHFCLDLSSILDNSR